MTKSHSPSNRDQNKLNWSRTKSRWRGKRAIDPWKAVNSPIGVRKYMREVGLEHTLLSFSHADLWIDISKSDPNIINLKTFSYNNFVYSGSCPFWVIRFKWVTFLSRNVKALELCEITKRHFPKELDEIVKTFRSSANGQIKRQSNVILLK